MIKLSRFLYAIPLVCVALLSVLFWRGLHIDPHYMPSSMLNKPLPSFHLPTLVQKNASLSATDFKGHLSLLIVFASWCLSCQEEQPMLMQLSTMKTISLFGLNYKDNPTDARLFLSNFGNPFKKVGQDNSGDVGINLGVYGTPETFLIDQHGIIREKVIGGISKAIWQHKLLPIINQLDRRGAKS